MTKYLKIIIGLTLLILIITACKEKSMVIPATVNPISNNRITPSSTELRCIPVRSLYPTQEAIVIPSPSFMKNPIAKATSVISKSLATPINCVPVSTASIVLYEPYVFVTSWGTKGTLPGKFLNPVSIGVDSDTYVYVADSNNNCIQKFDSNGHFIIKWGSKGKEKGQFNTPQGIAVSNNGYLIIADSRNNRIQTFDSIGNFINMWTVYMVHEIAVDLDKNVYTPDDQGIIIGKFNFNGKPMKEYMPNGLLDLRYSFGQIVIDHKGYIYVVYATHPAPGALCNKPYYRNINIHKFDSNCKFVREWGTDGDKDGQFSSMIGLGIDDKGYIYTADPAANRIQKFDSSGNFITKFGSKGSSNGQFNKPSALTIDTKGNIYVVDSGNYRIQKFKPEN
jgi:hypothetical protein